MGKAIGIDLGTSNTVVSYIDKKGRVKIYKEKGELTIPSALYLKSRNEIEIGEEALKYGQINPQSLIVNYKYDIGDSKKKQYKAANGDRVALSSIQITTIVLTEVLKRVTKKLMKDFPGEDIDEAVITVPAKFNPVQKKNTKLAAEKAGLQNVKLALESTAAAIAYSQENDDLKSKVLVYDFGGGTFDVSLIEKTSAGFKEVVTPQGDRQLGGNLITKRIADYIFDEIEENMGIVICKDRNDFDEDDYDYYPEDIYVQNYNNVYNAAEKIKKSFSEVEEIQEYITVIFPSEDGNESEQFQFVMDFETFYSLVESDIDRTIEIVDKTVKDSGENKEDITVILTGGSSLLKPVQIKLEDYFDRAIEVFRPATLISEGACILTEIMNGLQIEGNLPNDIGVKAFGPLGRVVFETLLAAGTSEKNAQATKDFELNMDNQKFLSVQLYERDIKNYPNAVKINDDGCIEIETLKIDLPSNLKKSETIVRLTLKIENDGTLFLDISLFDKFGKKIVDEKLLVQKESVFE